MKLDLLAIFKEKYKNKVIPLKVQDLIKFAETSDPWDFNVIIDHKRNYFIFGFTDFENQKYHYANSALWDEEGFLEGGFYTENLTSIPPEFLEERRRRKEELKTIGAI